ncbi:hypothetical protein ACFL27_20950 [candidate division CSSED10-310 bacterium]|uniref:Uncharacterized protein n=1 Tax=candidate division CSSED10-310 bacterium TaxID=2855610 RepID=A0ABV6Z2K0_UNCC1
MNDQHNGLTDEERQAFQALREGNYYSRKNEDRIVKTLKKQGLIQSSPRPGFQNFLWLATAAAALILTFMLGVQYGRQIVPQPSPAIEHVETKKIPSVPDLDMPRSPKVANNQLPVEDYRDEPDRPGNENELFAKTLRSDACD